MADAWFRNDKLDETVKAVHLYMMAREGQL